MAQRPLAVPFTQAVAQFRCLRRLVTGRDIPNHYYTLHRPHPRGQLLHALPTPMLRGLDVHYLFARAEQDLDGPPPCELGDHPRPARLPVRREQVAIPHPPRLVPYDHHLDSTV